MNNSVVEQLLNSCATELDHVKALVTAHGVTSSISPYLTKYAIIRASGVIEQSFKTIIADYCSHRSKKQIKRYVNLKVRDASSNPSYNNICKCLKEFDEDWHSSFKIRIDGDPQKTQIMSSLTSLVEARNDFAHGGNPGSSINDIRNYFDHARQIIEHMDLVVC
jgi:hypothetical protein